jgi:drug/metabolite transporter (DMT)-like permease
MLDLVAKVLGFQNGATVLNKAAGVVNYGIVLSALTWGWLHRDEVIHFEASLGFVALLGGVAFIMLEVSRRSTPDQHG